MRITNKELYGVSEEQFAELTGLRVTISTISDGNMHPNLEPTDKRDNAQKRFEAYCAARQLDHKLLAGMRIDPRETGLLPIYPASDLTPLELGTVDPLSRRKTSGLYSSSIRVGMFTLVGDCFPTVLASPSTRECALLHINWRMVSQGIGGVAIREFRSKLSEIYAYVGPGISVENNWFSNTDPPVQLTEPGWKDYITSGLQPVTKESGWLVDTHRKFIDDLSRIGLARIVEDPRSSADPVLYSKKQTELGLGDPKPRGNNVFIVTNCV